MRQRQRFCKNSCTGTNGNYRYGIQYLNIIPSTIAIGTNLKLIMVEIKVPTIGESISEVTLLKWVKNDGDYVDRDEVIAELESEKATFEVNAEGRRVENACEGR